MGLFGKKKKKQPQRPQPSARTAEARTDSNAARPGTQTQRQPSTPKGRGKQAPSSSKSPSSSPRKQLQLPAADAPPSILHRTHQHGGDAAGNNPRVRFVSAGEQSVASQSAASVPHMMVGANSVASSSAMSSNEKLNKVMDEEYKRLNAMGMGFERGR